MQLLLCVFCTVLSVTRSIVTDTEYHDQHTFLLKKRVNSQARTTSIGKAATQPTRILFVGNSFTYVHDLPHQLKHIAESLGRSVKVDKVAVGGSYLLHTSTLHETRMKLRQDWDYIVVQDFSLVPTVQKARDRYLQPALRHFQKRKKKAKVVAFMTWGYQNGLGHSCPYGGHYHIGQSLAVMQGCATCPSCDTSLMYREMVANYPCMQYSLARGILSMLGEGADIVAPCGLAWQVAQGSHAVPQTCKALIDEEYSSQLPIELPLNTTSAGLTTNPQRQLYIANQDGTFDKHPNRAGQYVNALVFYSTLFGSSPVGAAAPLETHSDHEKAALEQVPLSEMEIAELQELAFKTVRACGKACGLTIDPTGA